VLTFMGYHKKLDGYGYGTIQISRELQRIDPGVTLLDMTHANAEHTDATVTWSVPGTAVALCTPDWLPKIQAEHLITYTMFEATRLPAGWVEKINTFTQLCLVPCTWCANVFRDNGVTVPIEVVKWGINPEDYWPLARNPHPTSPMRREHRGGDERPYTFLWSGTADRRKGWDVAYRAFMRAFEHDKRAQLHLHFRNPLPANPRFGDPNVRVTIGLFDRPELRTMLAEADCFVFPSRGEGWGSPPREAAATGLPVLATNYGGLAEEIEQWALPIETSGFSKAEYGFWDDIGDWVEPSVEHCATLMRWCFDHQTLARQLGYDAAQWLRTEGTWRRSAEGVLNAVESEVKV
jgi:glycosyltransferase involved in cell wall biosynthesis